MYGGGGFGRPGVTIEEPYIYTVMVILAFRETVPSDTVATQFILQQAITVVEFVLLCG